MLRKTTSSPLFDRMLRSAAPLKDHLGINHFWYYKVTDSGHYSYIGTHTAWNEYCFDHEMLINFPCLRNPSTLRSGIILVKNSAHEGFRKVLDTAWEKFKINFNINLLQKIPEGIEAFGFATEYNHPSSDQKLLNELGLLRNFTQLFRKNNQRLFQLLEDNPVDIAAYFGPLFHECEAHYLAPSEREVVLVKLGLMPAFQLTPREKEILRWAAEGYPAPYIASKVFLSRRTVENYIDIIKGKLSCYSKVELIQKAKELAAIGYLET